MAKAKSAKEAKGEVQPRNYSLEKRRELFLQEKKRLSTDWRVLREDAEEKLIPFNRLALDYGLALEGIAMFGTVYHFHGDEGSGKSSIVIDILNEYMRSTGEPVGYFDYERRLKGRYLKAQGFDESMAFIGRPDSMEEGVKQAVELMEKGVRVFAFDSIPRIRPHVSIEDIKSGKAFKVQPGTHARCIQQFYDIILEHIARVDGVLFMVNQTRSRIEMTHEAEQAAKGYATVTNLNYNLPGGKANRFHASVMVENTKKRAWRPGKHDCPFAMEHESSDDYVCLEIQHRSLKNTVTGTGFRIASSYIRPGLGIDENISIRVLAHEHNVIAWSGKYWYAGESVDNNFKVWNNKEQAIEALTVEQDEELMAKIKALTAEKMAASGGNTFAVSDDQQRYLAGEEDDPTDELDDSKIAIDNANEL
jgi:RecA/RadA recombinase